jgi:hypothetical protein
LGLHTLLNFYQTPGPDRTKPVIFATQSFYLLRFFCLLFLVLVIAVTAGAQPADTLIAPPPDSLASGRDSILPDSAIVATGITVPPRDLLSMRPVSLNGWEISRDTPFYIQVLQHHPYFPFNTESVAIRLDRRKFEGKELLFYVLAGLLLVFALLKQVFAKYFSDLFRVFFRTTLKQRQIREQLMQNPLPSLLFNLFFIATTGLYADFLFHHFGVVPIEDFWLFYLYCCAALSLIYLGKYIGLKIAGWLFNMKEAAASYIFIVFIINKVIGIFLLPVLVLLAFTGDPIYPVSLVLSWCGIGALLLYRFVLGLAAVRNEVRVNLFHFFLYLCAFELAPLLLIYKLLLLVFK